MCFQGKDRLNKNLGKGARTYPIIAPKEGDHNSQILVEFLLTLTLLVSFSVGYFLDFRHVKKPAFFIIFGIIPVAFLRPDYGLQFLIGRWISGVTRWPILHPQFPAPVAP